MLRHGIWHTTGPQETLAIINAGEIRPNRREFRFSYPQTANSYGFYKGYVCLFDFAVLREAEYVDFHERWSGFFLGGTPFTVAIELDRTALGDRLIPNGAARAELGFRKVWIPHVEVWHNGPINLATAGRRCLLIAPSTVGHEPVSMPLDDPRLISMLQRASQTGSKKERPLAVRPEFENQLQEWEEPTDE